MTPVTLHWAFTKPELIRTLREITGEQPKNDDARYALARKLVDDGRLRLPVLTSQWANEDEHCVRTDNALTRRILAGMHVKYLRHTDVDKYRGMAFVRTAVLEKVQGQGWLDDSGNHLLRSQLIFIANPRLPRDN